MCAKVTFRVVAAKARPGQACGPSPHPGLSWPRLVNWCRFWRPGSFRNFKKRHGSNSSASSHNSCDLGTLWTSTAMSVPAGSSGPLESFTGAIRRLNRATGHVCQSTASPTCYLELTVAERIPSGTLAYEAVHLFQFQELCLRQATIHHDPG